MLQFKNGAAFRATNSAARRSSIRRANQRLNIRLDRIQNLIDDYNNASRSATEA
ncbi:MAG: hypothetical protein RLZZ283_723 [Candidatus Parcubacteria bacterium]